MSLHHASALTGTPEKVIADISPHMRRWRTVVRPEPNGVLTLSAEKGYTREAGNLLFHFSLIGLLAAIAVG
ncbi:cytochrome c biogenesis protein ResB, partial [Janibacter hoylei]|uniref:cytochrome c biogenesis protein ResB n=1 Tax=Janibacter hoylei TaxID=364298 RepID=UPI0024926896